MAQNFTIARPYAKALFELSKAQATTAVWSALLISVAEAFQEDAVRALIHNPRLTTTELTAICDELIQLIDPKTCATLGEPVRHFIHLLVVEKRLAILTDIVTLYLQYVAALQGVVEVVITSALPLMPDQQANIATASAARFQKKVAPTFTVDSHLIGGMVIRAGDWVMDGSIRTNLSKLNMALSA